MSDQTVTRDQVLIERFKRERPRFTITKRGDSKFLQTILWPIKKISGQSFGEYATTLFSTVYVPDDWDSWDPDARYALLRHEIKHVRRFNTWPFNVTWLWWLNNFLTAFMYLLCFPVLLTMRAWFEREGYGESLLVYNELGWMDVEKMVAWVVEQFSGPNYLYMWRAKPAEAWARQRIADIQAGKITNTVDRVD